MGRETIRSRQKLKTALHTYDLTKYNIEHLNLVFMSILGCLQIRNYALLVTPVMLLMFDCIDKWTFCYNLRASYQKGNLWWNTYFEISKYNMVGQVKLEFCKKTFLYEFKKVLNELRFIRVEKKVSKMWCTISSLWNTDCLLKYPFSKFNKHIVDWKFTILIISSCRIKSVWFFTK